MDEFGLPEAIQSLLSYRCIPFLTKSARVLAILPAKTEDKVRIEKKTAFRKKQVNCQNT